MPVLSFLDNLPDAAFPKSTEFWDSTQNMLNFGLGTVPP